MSQRKSFSALQVALLTVPLFFLFYIETLSIGPIRISILWKGLLTLLLGLFVIAKGLRIVPKPSLIGYCFCIACLCNVITSQDLANSVNAFVRFSIAPLIIHALSLRSDGGRFAIRALNFLSLFAFFSSIPFLTGMVRPLVDGYSLSDYGIGEAEGYIGVFSTPHTAAIFLGGGSHLPSLVLLLDFKKSKENCLVDSLDRNASLFDLRQNGLAHGNRRRWITHLPWL